VSCLSLDIVHSWLSFGFSLTLYDIRPTIKLFWLAVTQQTKLNLHKSFFSISKESLFFTLNKLFSRNLKEESAYLYIPVHLKKCKLGYRQPEFFFKDTETKIRNSPSFFSKHFSVTSWQPVLLEEETRMPGENH
jgi:hypothetical protein